jgi:hypothetical protein
MVKTKKRVNNKSKSNKTKPRQTKKISTKSFFKSLDKDNNKFFDNLKTTGEKNIFIKYNKCIKDNCSGITDKINAIKEECIENNKYYSDYLKCYFNKVFKTNLFKKHADCIKNKCTQEKNKYNKLLMKKFLEANKRSRRTKKGGGRTKKGVKNINKNQLGGGITFKFKYSNVYEGKSDNSNDKTQAVNQYYLFFLLISNSTFVDLVISPKLYFFIPTNNNNNNTKTISFKIWCNNKFNSINDKYINFLYKSYNNFNTGSCGHTITKAGTMDYHQYKNTKIDYCINNNNIYIKLYYQGKKKILNKYYKFDTIKNRLHKSNETTYTRSKGHNSNNSNNPLPSNENPTTHTNSYAINTNDGTYQFASPRLPYDDDEKYALVFPNSQGNNDSSQGYT